MLVFTQPEKKNFYTLEVQNYLYLQASRLRQ